MSKSTITPRSNESVNNSYHSNKSDTSTLPHDLNSSFTRLSGTLTRRALWAREEEQNDIRSWVDTVEQQRNNSQRQI